MKERFCVSPVAVGPLLHLAGHHDDGQDVGDVVRFQPRLDPDHVLPVYVGHLQRLDEPMVVAHLQD